MSEKYPVGTKIYREGSDSCWYLAEDGHWLFRLPSGRVFPSNLLNEVVTVDEWLRDHEWEGDPMTVVLPEGVSS